MAFTGKLDNYQKPAVDKFLSRKSLLIAYDMGLGKSPMSIMAAEELFECRKINCCLIVCPASLKYQWAQKIAEFTDCETYSACVGKEIITVPLGTYCILIDGDKKTRESRYNDARNLCPKYIIIGYDNVLIDYNDIQNIKAEFVILDEATAIKNFKAARSKRIKKALKAEYRLALTGTPVENKPEELFSIMQWVDSTVLGRYDLFEKAYINRNKNGWITSYKNLGVLKKKLEPAISRMTASHADVRELMPEIDEKTLLIDPDKPVSDLYLYIAKDMLAEMNNLAIYSDFSITDHYQGIDESQTSGKLMAMYVCLEMLTDHPDLIIWSGMQYQSEKNGGSKYAYELWQSGLLDKITHSPKLSFFETYLSSKENSKILVYSKYKYLLQVIQNRYPDTSVQHHGSMSPKKKAESIIRFRNDPGCKLFLSSHSGAYGLDMNMSDLLVNYDLPWSAGKQDQINSRHRRRSSQFRTVSVRNLVLKNSFEERRLRILDRKKRLGSAILDGIGADAGGRITLDGDSLREHLEIVIRNNGLL